jgi:hypothetical protein
VGKGTWLIVRAGFLGSLVGRVLDPTVNACFYPDGLVLLGGAASVFTLAALIIPMGLARRLQVR